MARIIERGKKSLFIGVIIALLLGTLALAEWISGLTENVKLTRQETKKFVNESAHLLITTKRLQPQLRDEFINEQIDAEPTRLLRTDQFGFILGPSDVKYTDQIRSILFLGGSTTENNEVDEQYRFPFLSAFQLSKSAAENFEGINAGVRGHTSHDSLNLYLNHPSPKIRSSEVVVVMHNINDRLHLTLHDSYRSYFMNPSVGTSSEILESTVGLAASIWNWLRLNSNFFFLADAVFQKVWTVSSKGHGIQISEGVLDAYTGVATRRIHLFEQSLLNLIAVIKANGQIPIMMTQPLGKPSIDQDAFNEVIRNVAKGQSVGLIDLAISFESLPKGPSLFYDDAIHFNNVGSKWAAEEIARSLQKILINKNQAASPKLSKCNDLQVNGKSLLASPLYDDVLQGRYPSFDKSEQRILFQHNGARGSSIVVLNLLTGLRDELINNVDPVGLEHPTWIDDQRILFTKRAGDNRKLMIFNINDRTTSALLNDQKLQGAISNISHDGTIYFSGYQYKNNNLPALYRISKIGADPKLLTISSGESWRPFSSKSGEIFFINNETSHFQIYSQQIDDPSASKRLVSPSEYTQWDPAVSDDGLFLAFAQREGGNFDVFVMRLDRPDQRPTRLITSAENEWDPRFSPSGRYLLYAATSRHGDQIRALCLK